MSHVVNKEKSSFTLFFVSKNFRESTYVTAFTDWFTTLTGKSAHFVLIVTMLYSSAELYPGVSLPGSLNLAVFIAQMLALDMGGIGLARMAKQAEQDGNQQGADNAKKFSGWLINIMIAGLITISVEQIVGGINWGKGSPIPQWIAAVKMLVELILIVARAVCAVKYGHIIHDLKSDTENTQETIGNLEAEKVTLQETIGNLEAEKVTLQGNLQSEKVTLQETIGNLETTIGNLQGNLLSDRVTISELKDTISNLEGDLKNRVTSIGNLDINLGVERDERKRLNEEVTILQDTINDMEATIKRLQVTKVTSEVTTGDLEATSEVTWLPDEVTTGDLEATSEVTWLPDEVTTEEIQVTKVTARERIKVTMAEGKTLTYKQIAVLADTTEAYVKKTAPGIKAELSANDPGDNLIEFGKYKHTEKLPVIEM